MHRSRLRVVPISLLISVVLVLSAPGLSAAWPTSLVAQPNIILILADDLDAASIVHMPNLTSLLIDQGTSFSNAYVSVPTCCPSRASILRGQYAHNHHVLTNSDEHQGGFAQFYTLGNESSTIATWLQAAGYRTALLGKYLNHYPLAAGATYVPPGWSEWYGLKAPDIYEQYNYKLVANGTVEAYGSEPADYQTDVLAGKAVDFIQRSALATQPFFVYLAPVTPHVPATPAPRHADAFPGVTAPRPPSFDEADVGDKRAWVQELPPLTEADKLGIDSLYRKRLQSLLAVDDLIGSLVTTLTSTGQLSNTYLVFTSDNGHHMGEHRLRPQKNTAYEEDIHVPLLIRGPGVPAGVTRPHFVANIDLAPTFADWAGVTTPELVDGRSLRPLLRTTPQSIWAWRNRFLIEHWTAEHNLVPEFAALRTATHQYVEYITGERELYDMRSDPSQLSNIVSTADAAFVASLSSQLHALQGCAGVQCREYEQAGTTLMWDTFVRTEGSGWGRAPKGGDYTLGGLAGYAVDGDVGTMTVDAGSEGVAVLSAVQALDVDLQVRVQTDRPAEGGSQFTALVARAQADRSEYCGVLLLAPDGSVSLRLYSFVNGIPLQIGDDTPVPALEHTANSFIWLRMQVRHANPSTLRLKAWSQDQGEPEMWHLEALDSSAGVQVPGAVGLRGSLEPTTTNAPVQFAFDNFRTILAPLP